MERYDIWAAMNAEAAANIRALEDEEFQEAVSSLLGLSRPVKASSSFKPVHNPVHDLSLQTELSLLGLYRKPIVTLIDSLYN